MSDSLSFGISLEDLVSGPAHKAAKAVDDLSLELGKAKEQLAGFEAQLKLANLLGDVAGHEKYAAAVEGSSRKVFELGNALDGAAEKGPAAASGLEQIAAQAPGVAKVAIAVAAIGIAVGGVLLEIGKAGVETALEVNAFNAQMTATFDALGKGPDAGKRTVEMLDGVARELPQSREQLASWTREIEKMGVTDLGKVRQELLATASAQALLSEGGDQAYMKISRKVNDAIEGHHKLTIAAKELTRTIGTNMTAAIAQKMGLSLEKLEQQLKAGTVDAAKFGDAMETTFIERGAKGLDAMWLKTGVLTGKLRDNFRELFSDVEVKPITDAMRELIGLFDQGQPSGQGMKASITDAFNGIIRAIGDTMIQGEILFLEIEVWGLSAELALRPVWNMIKLIGRGAEEAGKALGLIQPPGAGAGAAPTSPIAGAFTAGQDILDPVGALMRGLGGVVKVPGIDVGVAVGEGLVEGMLSMLGLVDATGQQLGKAATDGAANAAQVKSPSRVTMEIGGYMAEGLTLGMANHPGPARAGRTISTNALGGLGKALGGAPANGNAGGDTNVHGVTINIQAPQGVTDAASISATGLALALERFQLASGR